MAEKPLNQLSDDVISMEIRRYITGEASRYAPERLTRAFGIFHQLGTQAGIQRLREVDADLANEMSQDK